MEWYLKVLQNYTGFQGRASRKEFWGYFLFNMIIVIILTVIQRVIHLNNLLTGLYSLATLLPTLAVIVRRLHDTGRSGKWFFISFIPLVGSIILLVILFQNSQENENQFGPIPKLV